jgi:hypothetical protein
MLGMPQRSQTGFGIRLAPEGVDRDVHRSVHSTLITIEEASLFILTNLFYPGHVRCRQALHRSLISAFATNTLDVEGVLTYGGRVRTM